MNSSIRTRVVQILRYTLGGVVLLWVLNRGNWEQGISTLRNIPTITLIIVILLSIIGLLFRFLMWYSCIESETATRFSTAAEIDVIVNFINQLLPSRIGGRAAAPFIISQRTDLDIPVSIGVTGVNTALYSFIYGIVGIIGIGLIWRKLSLSVLGIVTLSTVLYLAAGAVLYISGLNATAIDTVTKRVVRIFEQISFIGDFVGGTFNRIPSFTEQSAEVFQNIFISPSTIGIYTIGWLGSVALFPALRVAVLFDAFGAPFTPLITLPAILVAAYSITLLPLTPGGIGVTEATATAVFVSLGIPYEFAAATILVDRVLGVYLPSLLGWYPMVSGNQLTPEND